MGLSGSGMMLGVALERRVAAIFRTLGAEVHHDVALGGNRIDIVVREIDATGTTITTAIECKSFSRPVTAQPVSNFAAVVVFLRSRSLVDRGIMVSAAGYTDGARVAAGAGGIELLTLSDLERRVTSQSEVTQAERDLELEDEYSGEAVELRAFVVMPFAQEFTDVYILGIRDVAEKLGVMVERADHVEYNGEILTLVRQKIQAANVIIGDVTGRNPNVFYEIGFAHALNRPVILIARAGEQLPFDIQSMNCITFASIVELRERLERRLKATLPSLGAAGASDRLT